MSTYSSAMDKVRGYLLSNKGSPNGYVPPQIVDGELVFEIFVLGTRGSGKSLFLAALYRQLAVMDHTTNNYFIELPEKQSALRQALISTYNQATNPNTEWPAGTVTVNTYEFCCLHYKDGKSIPLFRFLCRDYPGAFFEGGSDAFNIASETERAHSIAVLIDGQKVLQGLTDESEKGHLHQELDTTVPFLQRCADRPVQFILTKWDVLHPRYKLAEVKDLLMENGNFEKFIDQRISRSLPIHLIPVSAMGYGFATFDQTKKRMKKMRGRAGAPQNVELALGFTITDHLQLLARQSEDPGFKNMKVRLLSGIQSTLKSTIAGVLGAGVLLDFPTSLINAVVGILRSANEKVAQNQDETNRQIAEAVESIKDQKTAVSAIMKIQAITQRDFYRNFPGANLIEPSAV